MGVALSDESGLIARPFDTVRRTGDRQAIRELKRIAAENEVTRIVVGLPLSMSGGEQPSTAAARRLASALEASTGLEVVVWDERLTTAQAERALIEGNVSRRRRRDVVDRVAAAVMLQSYLDSARSTAPAPGGGSAA